MPATIEAPPAPPTPATAPPPPAPAPTPVNLAEPSATPPSPARPGSARERMHREVAAKRNLEEPPARAPEKAAETPPKKPEGEKPREQPADEKPQPTEDAPPDQKNKNPWKLLRAEKERAAALERQVEEAKSSSLAETEKAKYEERIQKAETKLKEYEDEIRFKSYEKSDEFKTKYEEPYEKAWSKHMHDLRGVTVLDDGGNSRPMTATDILDLVNLELPDARKLATEKWGDFAQDAMLARKEIRDLFESKNNALAEARKTGSEREKQLQERGKKWMDDTKKHVSQTWESANKAVLSNADIGEFFKPVEGDDTVNQLLGKGFALVDKAFSENPMDPKLTPEQRTEVVRRHAAVRNRAAAFGRMKHEIRKLREEVAALKKSNGQFKASEPSRAGGTSTTAVPAATKARDRMYQAQEKWIK
ncbi:MAG TPA: hypothetical protein VMJ12_08615 [Candidatus Acidoferrales bacterium]|nr:hypothetical protein [Candidatus Acidoferrales bacterium]